MELDSIDEKLLKMLMGDGRVPLKEMAKDVGLSSSGVRARVKKLEEERVIQGYTIKVDPKKYGRGVVAFLYIDVEPGATGRVAGALSRSAGICEVHRTTGSPDLVAKYRAEGLDDIDEFVEGRVSTYHGVRKVSFTVAAKTYKEEMLSL